MTTSTILLLLVGAASTIAFTPPQAHVHRSRRAAASGSTSGASSSSFSSSSSGAGAGSVSGPGYGGGYGGGNFGGAGQPFYNNQPFDYDSLFRQFYEHLQRLSQMHAAYANNIYGASITGSSGHGHFGWAANVASPQPYQKQTVPYLQQQNAAPAYMMANPLAYTQSSANVWFPTNRYGPGFGSNSLDYGGSSAGGYGGFGNRGGFGGSYGGPGFQPGFVHSGGFGGFGSQPGSSSSSSSGIQGGYGGQGGFGGSGSQPGFGASGAQPGFGTSGAQPGFGASGAQPGFGASGVQQGFATSGSSPNFGSGGYGSFSGTGTGYGNNPGASGAPGATAGLDTRAGFANTDSSSSGPVGAQASVSLSDRGGFGEASYFPPGLGSRIGQDIPAPTGGNFAVFSSSSSGTSDVNGKRTSYKEATYGVNDNGKVSTFSVKDP